MSGHTPGPWRARRSGGGIVVTSGLIGSIGRVATIEVYDNPEAHADANLIAAAPDLLEALKDLIEADPPSPNAAPDSICARALAAIAKAEGAK